MPRGLAINIGLNRVDPIQYGNQFPILRGSENDARDMHGIARAQGFEAEIILASEAKSDRVINAINRAAELLNAGDILLLTYAGHGSQIIDNVHGEDEDGMDETLVLFDRNLIDDELFALWSRFKPGVRILFISDSCHSGTIAFIAADNVDNAESAGDEGFFPETSVEPDEHGELRVMRSIPTRLREEHFARFQPLYDSIRSGLPDRSQIVVRSSVIQIGACQDNQKAADGARNGLFTEKLRRVWNGGAFIGNYHQFFDSILASMPARQQPKFVSIGTPNAAFESQRIFSI
jgi:hypothetical protein